MCINPIIPKFSRFRVFGDRNGGILQTDRQLERHMQHLVNSDPKATEEVWISYFLKVLRDKTTSDNAQEQDYAQRHLSAYLQETCSLVAIELKDKYRYVKSFTLRYSYQDYFQIANIFISSPKEFLRNFDFTQESYFRTYAKKRLMGQVRDEIYRDNKESQLLKYRDWALLRKVSKKEMKLALNYQLYNEECVTKYLLIWLGFKEIYIPIKSLNSQGLAPPTPEIYQQIADYYNQQAQQFFSSTEKITGETVEKMLNFCIDSIRKHLSIRFVYPDRERKNDEASPEEFWEEIISSQSNSNVFWELMEKDENLNKINTLIAQAFNQLYPEEQNLLRLWKTGLGLTQAEIASIFNCKQYKISRQLNRFRRKLFDDFIYFVSQQRKIQIKPENLEIIKDLIEESLINNSSSYFFDVIKYTSSVKQEISIIDFNQYNIKILEIIAYINIRTIILYFSLLLYPKINLGFDISLQSYELITKKWLCKWI